jgi:hypothetical protein
MESIGILRVRVGIWLESIGILRVRVGIRLESNGIHGILRVSWNPWIPVGIWLESMDSSWIPVGFRVDSSNCQRTSISFFFVQDFVYCMDSGWNLGGI